ncbi:MAG: hypothetical protein K0Q49_2257 [Haloplasmataceae bacterium]|jgi:hypothetical protein|nr:hypothetical protein [Haloplasmataceae bacterium]
MHREGEKVKKGDIYIIMSIFILFAVLFIAFKIVSNVNGDRYVEIYVKNDLILSEKLTEFTDKRILLLSKDNNYQEYKILEPDETIPSDLTGFDLIHIYNNGVQVIDADCPYRVVVKQGFMKHSNIPLICLPRKLVITIKARNENSGIDGIAS